MDSRANLTTTVSTKKRGPKEKLSDHEMKELALKIKNKIKHQQLTYSLLERETGIGRNTWMRRIKNFIDELNTPIARNLGLSEGDDVYFPNIEYLFELYDGNKQKIINELHQFEILFQDLWKEHKSLREQNKKLKEFENKIEEYKNEMSMMRQQLLHYKTMYEKLTVSSAIPHLREEYGLNNNVIKFNKNDQTSIGLTNLKEQFPSVNNIDQNDVKKENNMKELQSQFPDLF